jgi:hypothetical protein
MRAGPVIPQPTLIFDTGPLLELVIYSAVHVLGFASLKDYLRYLQDPSSYERVSNFVAFFPKKTTTAHVITEISSWIIRNTRSEGHFAVWGLVYREFSAMGMDEDVLKLVEMPQQLVADFGAADAGILQLASGLGRANSTIFSVDSALIAECRRVGVNARDLWEVIFEVSP